MRKLLAILMTLPLFNTAAADLVPADEAKMDQLQKNGLDVVATESVRVALAAVEAGNAEVAFAHRTDAAISKQVRVIYAIPEKETPEIRYPVAILRETKRRAAAERFVRYLGSSAAYDVFWRLGLVVQR